MNSSSHPLKAWKILFSETLHETDPQKLVEKINIARHVILDELEDALYAKQTQAEAAELSFALETLSFLPTIHPTLAISQFQ